MKKKIQAKKVFRKNFEFFCKVGVDRGLSFFWAIIEDFTRSLKPFNISSSLLSYKCHSVITTDKTCVVSLQIYHSTGPKSVGMWMDWLLDLNPKDLQYHIPVSRQVLLNLHA